MEKTLHLNLKKKWFDMIATGEKKEEYREVKEFYIPRLLEVVKPLHLPMFSINYNKLNDIFWFCAGYKKNRHKGLEYLIKEGVLNYKEYDTVTFKNGYAKDARTITLKLNGVANGTAKPEWSDNWQGQVFIIKLGDILTQ